MIKLEHTVLSSPEQMEFVIEGMRNPMNSWDKSDSEYVTAGYDIVGFTLGKNDYSLMKSLSYSGTDHRKFMRMMPVYVRITAPLYWWKEFKTYRFGRRFGDDEPDISAISDEYLEYDIETNSCSTMHKITEKEFDLEDFSIDKIIDTGEPEYEHMRNDVLLTLHFDGERQYYDPYDIYCEILIPALNLYRKKYLETKRKEYWWQIIQLLPSSYNQTRNVMLNYEVLANMYKSRKNHKLDEWREFCKWIEDLPYSDLITGEEKEMLK